VGEEERAARDARRKAGEESMKKVILVVALLVRP